MRNKAKDFPNQNKNKFEGDPEIHAEFSSKRANGTINTHPQERMQASGEHENDSNNDLK